jgi:anti-anti-sigma regulatory factor
VADTAPRLVAQAAVGRSLFDGSLFNTVLFSQAQGVLVGLTGCTPERAAASLLNTAFELLLSPSEVAECLLRSMTTDDDQDGPILTRLATEALDAGPPHAARRVIRLDPAGRTSDLSLLHVVETWDGGVPGVRVRGELDLATAPDLTAAVSRAGRWPLGDRERQPLGDRERQPLGDRERQPLGDRERQPLGDRAREPLGDQRAAFHLDLEGVTFLDLTGLRILRAIHAQITEDGRHLLSVTAPIAAGCRRLLALAIERDWLPAPFDPALPTRV